jgi:hypothetical protein
VDAVKFRIHGTIRNVDGAFRRPCLVVKTITEVPSGTAGGRKTLLLPELDGCTSLAKLDSKPRTFEFIVECDAIVSIKLRPYPHFFHADWTVEPHEDP